MTKKKSAPYLKVRPRKNGVWARFWIPPAMDVKRGWAIKSRRIMPDIEAPDRETALEIANDFHASVHCRKWTQELKKWRKGLEESENRPKHGTWGWLVGRFEFDELSPFKEVGEATQREYAYYDRIIKAEIGERSIASTSGIDIKKFHKGFLDQGYVRKAYGVTRHLGRLASYGVVIGWPGSEKIKLYLANMRLKNPKARDVAPPEWKDIMALVEAADAMKRPSIGTATAIQFEAAQRQGDVIGKWSEGQWSGGLQWADIDFDRGAHGAYFFEQNKTGKRIPIAMSGWIAQRLKQTPEEERIGPVIISEKTGLPYKQRAFGADFKKIKEKAGWPAEMWNMDSRAGAVTEAIDRAEVDEALSQKLTGHSTKKAHDRYNRKTFDSTAKVVSLREASRVATDKK